MRLKPKFLIPAAGDYETALLIRPQAEVKLENKLENAKRESIPHKPPQLPARTNREGRSERYSMKNSIGRTQNKKKKLERVKKWHNAEKKKKN